jgi:DNA-binding NarL/FixJ family response regulator
MELTRRQAEIAGLVARGLPNKAIAERAHIAYDTVRLHVTAAAAKIPGDAAPRIKLTLWVFGIVQPVEGEDHGGK